SLASLTNSEKRGPDSQDLLDTFLGKSSEGRENLIIEAGGRTALRTKEWVYIPPYAGPPLYKNVNIESGNSETEQLYLISSDPGQDENIAQQDSLQKEKMRIQYLQLIDMEESQ
ncbi:MAG: arylsulfatase, partial [Cyclobacteriaceae bacterium]